MSKCCTCNKDIKNVYALDGKVYGYNCYKMALALKYINDMSVKNDSYNCKCEALIQVFRNKKMITKWNIDFQNSILNQYDDCKKLTINQFNCIVKKLDKIEITEYNLINYSINKIFDTEERTSEKNDIYLKFKNNSEILGIYKNDDRLHDLIKDYKSKKTMYIVGSKEDVDTVTMYSIEMERGLQELKEDVEENNDIEIIEIIKVV